MTSKRNLFQVNGTETMRVLNVAEKNDAAKNIAGLLSRGNRNMRNGQSVYNKIYTFNCDVPQLGGHCEMTMTSVSGHLLDFEFGSQYSNWNTIQELFDAPIIEQCDKRNDGIKKTLEQEARKHQVLIIWTDGDREGENIGFEIIRVCLSVNRSLRVMRAKFSEITSRAMNIAIRNLIDPDENVSKAVDIRRELDLRFGAIFTRYQTRLLQDAGHIPRVQGNVVSYGPCQFPTLGFIIKRYIEIMRFVPQPFWSIAVSHKKDGISVSFNWRRRRLFEEHACLAFYSKIMECPKARVTNIVGKPKSNWRPEPMHTTAMEKLASTKLKLTAKDAMSIAEKLYMKGYISYPRTETNIFPKGMNLNALVEQQVGDPRWGNFAQKILADGGARPRVGKKTDNAHPPIHPTKKNDGLTGREANLYELITRHFLACVSKDAVGNETTISIVMNGEEFTATGLVIFELNYLEVYTYFKWNAKEVPQFQVHEEFVPDSVVMNESRTVPPKLLTESELIALMEKHGIGTDATHAEHIDKIQVRSYVKKLPRNNRFCPTKLGLALHDGYKAMQFSHLVRPELRSRLERDLVMIAESRREARSVAQEYIDEHKNIYETVTREQQKLIDAFTLNKNMVEPEIRLKNTFPADYN